MHIYITNALPDEVNTLVETLVAANRVTADIEIYYQVDDQRWLAVDWSTWDAGWVPATGITLTKELRHD